MTTLEEQRLRHQQTVAGFNIYRTLGVRESLPEVHISTWYQGMLVDGVGQVLETRSDNVLFAIGIGLAKALERARFAFVESPIHGTCFTAQVLAVESGGRQVSLGDFQPFKDFTERRERQRVHRPTPC